MINLYFGDCLDIIKQIPAKSVNLVLTDPPYGTTPLKWDNSLDWNQIWLELDRVVVDSSAPILLFGQEPFSSMLRCSNMKHYKYDWYWEKERLTNVFQVKRRPGKVVETISVFYKNQCKYYPQKNKHLGKLVSNKIGENARFSDTMGNSEQFKPSAYIDDGTRHPTQVLRFNRENLHEIVHPTQKPVPLLEYLIKTYTQENETVLDFTMGSGSTGIACLNTNRNFIGIESDDSIFKLAENRINNEINDNLPKIFR